jgi:hypothetical protein
MKNIDFKKILPIGIGVILFAILTLGYLSPVLKGKVIVQGDIVSNAGMAKETNDFRAQYHEEALWTNSMFGGMPTYQISISYPNNLMRYVSDALTLWMPDPAHIVFNYMLGFFILLLVLRIDPWLSILGAIAFAFSAYFFIIIEAGHSNKGLAIGYMAPVFAGVILVNRGKYVAGGALTALFFALELIANHVQITYYLFLFLGVYIAFEWIPLLISKNFKPILKSIATFIVAGIIALGCNISNLWNTANYASSTIRGASELSSDQGNKTSGLDKDYATQWSMGVSETMTLMIPGFKGRSSTAAVGENKNALKNVDERMKQNIANTPQYWGDQPFTMSPYAGAIVVFLFVFGLFIVEGRLKWVLLIATIFSFLLSWGKNFMPLTSLFLDYFPIYNKFRTVSMILIVAEFTIPLLAVLAVDKLLKTPGFFSKKIKLAFINREISTQTAFFISFGLTGGLSLLYYLAPGLNDFFGYGEYDKLYDQIAKSNDAATADAFLDNLKTARINLFKSDAMRSFLFITAAGILIWLFLKSIIKKPVLIGVVGLLIFFDLVQIDRQFVNDHNFKAKQEAKTPFPLTIADKEILEDKDPDYRVLNIAVNTFNEAGTSYYHKSVGGYHAAKLRRYQDLIDHHIQNSIQDIIETLRTQANDSALRATFAKQGVLNMLNTKYIIYNREAPPLQNRYALGNAWFVNDIKMAKDPDDEIKILGEINPARTVVVDERFKNELEGFSAKPDASASIKLLDYKPNDLKYESNTTTEQLAVFSEIYYNKGWNAYVDGELKPHIGADYVLRAMRVPAGKHNIEFKFEPKPYYIGEKVSLISCLLLFGLIGGAIFLELKKGKATIKTVA